MFNKSAHVYDLIYQRFDYRGQAEILLGWIMERHPHAASLLDVGCGTGLHLEHLRPRFTRVGGLDLDPAMLAVARDRLPGVSLFEGDMTSFDLGERFDVVICMFSSVGYAGSVPLLRRSVDAMAKHLLSGGLLIVEPWITIDKWRPGSFGADFVDSPGIKIARMSRSTLDDSRRCTIHFDYLINSIDGLEHFTENHETMLFSQKEYDSAFEAAGLQWEHDPIGIARAGQSGRGMYFAKKP